MPAGLSKHGFLDFLIGWQGAAPSTRSRLLQVFCSGIRLRSLISNTIALLILTGLIITETQWPVDFVWIALVALSGLLPRIYAAHLRRTARFDQSPEAKALTFIAISAVYGLIWAAGPFLLLPELSGTAVGVLLMIMVFGTIMGPYAAMPGILYMRIATTGLPTLAAVALYTSSQVTLVSIVMALWLTLRTDVWRGYHRTLREQLELREAFELRQRDLERAHQETKQANRSLKTMAETDPLTGAANRRQFMGELEIVRGPAALVLIDVDRFKLINDQFGHQVGDSILVQLTLLAKEVLRKGDLLARLGGDEFAIILPNMDPAGSWTVAERVREGMEERLVPTCKYGVRATISLGVAVIPDGTTVVDPSALLGEADAALYVAKRQGRNRTSIAEFPNKDSVPVDTDGTGCVAGVRSR